jgi:hypothetical protein
MIELKQDMKIWHCIYLINILHFLHAIFKSLKVLPNSLKNNILNLIK